MMYNLKSMLSNKCRMGLIVFFSIFKILTLRTLELWNHYQVGKIDISYCSEDFAFCYEIHFWFIIQDPFLCVCLAFCYLACEFEMGGSEGIVESVQIMKEGKATASEAVDCKWYIRAPPRSKVSLKMKPTLDSWLEKCL